MPHQIRTTQLVLQELDIVQRWGLYTPAAGTRAVIKWASMMSLALNPLSMTMLVTDDLGKSGIILHQNAGSRAVTYYATGAYAVIDVGQTLAVVVSSVTGGNTFVNVGGVVFDL